MRPLHLHSWLFGLLVAGLLVMPSALARAEDPKTAKVDVNTATAAELQELPGVGEATAKKIIAGRPYKSVDDLAEAGVNAPTLAKIKPLVTASAAAAQIKEVPIAGKEGGAKAGAKVDLNTATSAELEELPGVGEATAKKIIAGRPYKSVDDLAAVGVNASTIGKITPLVTVAAAVPVKEVPAAGKEAAKAGEKVDLNTATSAELEALPGVGEATAKKIIAGRPYKAVDDLAAAGVNASTIGKITPLVTVSTVAAAPSIGKPPVAAPADHAAPAAGRTPATPADTSAKGEKPSVSASEPLDLNTATEAELQELPGIGEAYSKKIIAARPFATMEDLSKVGLPAATLAKITPLVTVEKPQATGKTPPHAGMVWVNTETKVYHKESSRWYGKTKAGEWMEEDAAVKAGYRLGKQ